VPDPVHVVDPNSLSEGSLTTGFQRGIDALESTAAQAPAGRIDSAPTRPWLTLLEVADLLHLSRAAAYRLPLDPSFPATRLGRTVRVERAALERWLKARTQHSRRAT
jgi:excisionase family DNA binding protein